MASGDRPRIPYKTYPRNKLTIRDQLSSSWYALVRDGLVAEW